MNIKKLAAQVRAAVAKVWADADPCEGASVWHRLDADGDFKDETKDRRVALAWARIDGRAPVHKWRFCD